MVLNCGPQPQYNRFWGLRNSVTTTISTEFCCIQRFTANGN